MSIAASRVRVAVAAFGVVSMAMMLRASGFNLSIAILFFGLWLLLPFLLAYRAVSHTRASRAVCIAMIVATFPPTLAYIVLAFPVGRQSSTAGLAFLFFPLWHLVLVGVCFRVAVVFERWKGRTRAA